MEPLHERNEEVAEDLVATLIDIAWRKPQLHVDVEKSSWAFAVTDDGSELSEASPIVCRTVRPKHLSSPRALSSIVDFDSLISNFRSSFQD